MGANARRLPPVRYFERLDVLEPIRHPAAELHERRTFATPPPPLQGPGRESPPARQLFLIQMPQLGRAHFTTGKAVRNSWSSVRKIIVRLPALRASNRPSEIAS